MITEPIFLATYLHFYEDFLISSNITLRIINNDSYQEEQNTSPHIFTPNQVMKIKFKLILV